ncbi:FAD-dependent thymidylate synthase [candidate division WOR-3 bacterium]|uniref:Flavin-dependent thymidylate synthase n=1 Tax=candidate division WOR-3 bacterium TaxID=2052148 RepID=A0A660SJY1_UNCW3|nr:MAG: FAD-dependent thymidylate synthase [candidate division WOR-3 bacterium]
MEVRLLGATPDPIRVIYTAARTCYSSRSPIEIMAEHPSKPKMVRLIKRLFAIGHHSVLEHVSFTFAIAGISRSCSHQLVRHRLASYSQQSQRYVTQSTSYIIPPDLKRDRRFQTALLNLYELYRDLLKRVEKEDARYLLPNAQATNLVMTMNLRELIHASSLRLCYRAQWEIRALFQRIRKLVREFEPALGAFLKPRCQHLGFCPEEEPCGRYRWVDRR